MATLKEAVATNLARILDEKGISQTELAKDLGVSIKTINGYVNARTGISVEMISKMAIRLGCKETDLTSDPDLILSITMFSSFAREALRDRIDVQQLIANAGEIPESLHTILKPGLKEFTRTVLEEIRRKKRFNQETGDAEEIHAQPPANSEQFASTGKAGESTKDRESREEVESLRAENAKLKAELAAIKDADRAIAEEEELFKGRQKKG